MAAVSVLSVGLMWNVTAVDERVLNQMFGHKERVSSCSGEDITLFRHNDATDKELLGRNSSPSIA
jgi:hypothetical protein